MPARSEPEARRSVQQSLVQVGRSISEAHDAVATREGLTPVGAELLLAVREPRPQGVVAEALGLTEPRLSVLASKLVERKLLRRKTTKGDKRFRILELTAAGRKVADRIATNRERLAPLGDLTDTQVKQLSKLLASVTTR
jgi:DNA-binding MarR family transcriptional regulator